MVQGRSGNLFPSSPRALLFGGLYRLFQGSLFPVFRSRVNFPGFKVPPFLGYHRNEPFLNPLEGIVRQEFNRTVTLPGFPQRLPSSELRSTGI